MREIFIKAPKLLGGLFLEDLHHRMIHRLNQVQKQHGSYIVATYKNKVK